MFQTTPENVKIVENLTAALSELPVGGTLLYEQLSQACGRDITKENQWLLARAINRVEENLGCILSRVRGVGVKRLNSADSPQVGLASIQKVRRIAKKGSNRLGRINTNSLDDVGQRDVIAYRAMLNAVATIADGRKASAIATVADPVKPIPPENIIQMFAGKRG